MCNRPEAIMLFAAGFGTRMGPLTAAQPKPMVRVAGRPLIDHALDLVRACGVARIVANLHYLPDHIRRHLHGGEVMFSHETPDILETGGGLRAALPMLGAGPVFTMNTDAVWRGANPLDQLARAWRPDVMDGLLLCIPPAQAIGHTGHGDFLIGADGRLTRGAGHVYSGVQIIKTDLLEHIPDHAFSLNLLWNRMLEDKRLYGAAYDGMWCDVGRAEGIAMAEEMLGQTGDV